jgi:hypothetical protein
MKRLALSLALAALVPVPTLFSAVVPGFVPIFNGRNLDGWQGLGGDTSPEILHSDWLSRLSDGRRVGVLAAALSACGLRQNRLAVL